MNTWFLEGVNISLFSFLITALWRIAEAKEISFGPLKKKIEVLRVTPQKRKKKLWIFSLLFWILLCIFVCCGQFGAYCWKMNDDLMLSIILLWEHSIMGYFESIFSKNRIYFCDPHKELNTSEKRNNAYILKNIAIL